MVTTELRLPLPIDSAYEHEGIPSPYFHWSGNPAYPVIIVPLKTCRGRVKIKCGKIPVYNKNGKYILRWYQNTSNFMQCLYGEHQFERKKVDAKNDLEKGKAANIEVVDLGAVVLPAPEEWSKAGIPLRKSHQGPAVLLDVLGYTLPLYTHSLPETDGSTGRPMSIRDCDFDAYMPSPMTISLLAPYINAIDHPPLRFLLESEEMAIWEHHPQLTITWIVRDTSLPQIECQNLRPQT